MKKLMIMVGAIAMAVCANAAAVTWYWTGVCYNGYKNTGSTATYEGKAAQGGTMYIFNANAKGVSQDAVLSAFLAGTAISGYMDSFTMTDGKMASTSKKTLADPYSGFAPVRTSGTTSYADYFYAMVVGDNIFITDTASAAIQTAKDTNLALSTMASVSTKNIGESTSFTSGGWYTSGSTPTPEPTSGLLMLLGMSALALRRRRA